MKLSVSLPDEDVAFLDSYAASSGIASRSAVVHQAVRLLRAADLGVAYEDAWQEWATSDEAAMWAGASADGVSDAAR
ncbi:MAG TPA: ribbon-helix-helix domain-containing protein [Mycobacteriales bacterium]|jgi:Arc/MetJ-type ribon-helix-helix transcriptional regulator|nr:ribbon-helix-helix domain-containing protein [Mycobacteriales bacterium]